MMTGVSQEELFINSINILITHRTCYYINFSTDDLFHHSGNQIQIKILLVKYQRHLPAPNYKNPLCLFFGSQRCPQIEKYFVKLKNILRSGQLVDDQTVIDVVLKVKQDAKYGQHLGLILDGVPRTIKQAKMLRDAGVKVDLIINFFNREEILLEKLMGRRVCPSCSRNYNIANINIYLDYSENSGKIKIYNCCKLHANVYFNTPDGYKMKPLLPKKKADECDDCEGVKLIVRDDDKESIIRDRMAVYREKTEPIIDFYKSVCGSETKVVDFEAKKGVDDYPEVKRILQETLKI